MRRAVGSILALALGAGMVSGQEPGPTATLKGRDSALRAVLGGADRDFTPAEEPRLRQILFDVFDYDSHAQECLGRHWTAMSEAERREARRLITLLLERSSLDKLRDFRSEAVQYVDEVIDPGGPAAATVTTRVNRKGERWTVAYRMRRTGAVWRIVDVVVEGASTIESNRAAFAKEIRATGVQGLLAKLRRKAAERRP